MAALAVIVGTQNSVAVQTRHLQLASTPWSPFTNVEGQARFALDLVNAALQRVGVTADTAIVAEASLTPSLLNGDYDGSAALWRDEERERALLYSEPYLENRLILVGRLGSDVSASMLSDLTGKRIALVEGYSYGDAIGSTSGPLYVSSSSEEDSLEKLLSGEADYTLMDELVVQYILTNHGEEARTRLAIGTAPLLVRSLHFALRRDLPDAQSIIGLFNAELRTMITDRSYHHFLHLDWIRADVDGDGLQEYVPRADQTGPTQPVGGYELFRIAERLRETPTSTQRFYVGGDIYEGWSTVPELYKAPTPGEVEPGRHTATIFRFTW